MRLTQEPQCSWLRIGCLQCGKAARESNSRGKGPVGEGMLEGKSVKFSGSTIVPIKEESSARLFVNKGFWSGSHASQVAPDARTSATMALLMSGCCWAEQSASNGRRMRIVFIVDVDVIDLSPAKTV